MPLLKLFRFPSRAATGLQFKNGSTNPSPPRLLAKIGGRGWSIFFVLAFGRLGSHFCILNNNIFHLEELSAIINNPQVYNLEKPYPNPFNPLSTINFSIPERSHLSIIIYDIKGQQVDVLHNQMINAGYHELIWDATSLSSGVYFVNMTSGSYNSVQKMILLK